MEECKRKFGEGHTYLYQNNHQEGAKLFSQADVVFDFIVHLDADQLKVYHEQPDVIAFVNSTTISVHELIAASQWSIAATLFGFCGLPTFLNRPVLEVSLLKEEQTVTLQKVCSELSTEYAVVEDRVGLVTPRIICMIINEAFYTVQEGTASRQDIDLGMKLGTNYPYGPFEWAQKIGVSRVYETLQALYEDTKDERYKICSLLKKEALQAKSM